MRFGRELAAAALRRKARSIGVRCGSLGDMVPMGCRSFLGDAIEAMGSVVWALLRLHEAVAETRGLGFADARGP